MDPNTTLQRLLEACHDNDREKALEAIEALQGWLARGGFVPLDPRRPAWMQTKR
jgi:hypothetical protein